MRKLSQDYSSAVSLSVCQFVCLLVCLSVSLSVCLSTSLPRNSASLSLSVLPPCLSAWVSICFSVYRLLVHMTFCLVCFTTCFWYLFMQLPISLSGCWLSRLPVSMSLCVSSLHIMVPLSYYRYRI